MKKKIFAVIVVVILILALFLSRVKLKEVVTTYLKPPLPAPKLVSDFGTVTPVVATVGTTTLPDSINLNVPFQAQAPNGDWGMPYQEACEEAASIMVDRFLTVKSLDAATMDSEILKLVQWEKETFGYYQDTTAAEIARIMHEYFGFKHVEVKYKFTIDDIKKEIAAGRPVILPAAGQLLHNPYFQTPGPVYHALVVKGYTATQFITNDAGTRRGENFMYDQEALMSALHEWDPVDILKGRPAMIVVYR